jgi:hypothetical protein
MAVVIVDCVDCVGCAVVDCDEEDSVDWQGAVIAVVGLYDKGELIVLLIVVVD